jgi:HK97 family phage prohead protease
MDDVPLGNIVAAREDKKGLWFKAELPKDVTFVSGRIIPQVKRKGLKGVSIGYKAIDRETRKSDGARLLKQINLVEISFVPRPMNPLAEIESVKSLQEFDPMRALEGVFAEMQRLTRDLRG